MLNDFEKPYITVTDHLVSGETFQLFSNGAGSILKTVPQPAEEDLAKYYESDAYISHTDGKKGIVPLLYQTVKKHTLKKKVSLITNLNNGAGTVLDVGAGTGDFLNSAQQKGWGVFGVEVNEKAKQLATLKNIKMESSLSAFKNKTFDVITLWHVLEHIPNLGETIAQLKELLVKNGTLIIAVPNYNSFDAKYYKQFWAAYDVPRHLWHFSRKGLPKLLAPNFSLEKIKPMFFDSFYVSLLSEKYRSQRSFSVRALCVGFWSNISAWRTKEYSSHIYCFKKEPEVHL
ncbi:MAG: class I SAM-dependent methyltransferase [Marinirhabdus sp.]